MTVLHGDCLDVMRTLDAESVDAIVSDPPYGLSFMGKEWDHGVPGEPFWREALRVAKPGAHLVAFGGTRTYHRLACAIEDAGWEIRDCLSWLYGSGFPKSLDVSKAMDKVKDRSKLLALGSEIRRARAESGMTLADVGTAMQSATNGQYGAWYHRGGHMFFETGMALPSRPEWNHLREVLPIHPDFADVYDEAEREVVGRSDNGQGRGWAEAGLARYKAEYDITAPATDLARQWQGWGTALKPAWESIILARKPLPESSELAIILANLSLIEARLCLLSDAASVAMSLPSSHHDSPGVWRTAQWTADERDSTWADLSGQMGTWPCALAVNTCLNTVTSWSGILADALTAENTFTTETGSSTTTDWKTLKFCLSALTLPTIIQAATNQRGLWWSVVPAARAFNAAVASIAATRERFVLDAVTSAERERCQDADAPDFSAKWEPIILARKPLTGTVAANVAAHGTGAINVDGCRIASNDKVGASGRWGFSGEKGWNDNSVPSETSNKYEHTNGRWPANVVLDEEAAAMLGEPARFFYTAKASRREREAGLEGMPQRPSYMVENGSKTAMASNGVRYERHTTNANHHPTVKPIALMRWLCRLVTPPNGLILDPFCGSGSTGCAAVLEGFRFTGIEREAEYVEIANRRIAHWAKTREQDAEPSLFCEIG